MMYARSDVRTVNIGPGHHSCGQVHERPVNEAGEPVQLWALSCPGGCEEFLRTDPCWSATLHEVPESPDEQKAREGANRHGKQAQEQIVALALAKLAGIDTASLPGSMTRSALGAAPVAGMVSCPACAAVQSSGANYCGSCGSAMRSAVPAAAIPAGTAA
jgi:hypothetical protein